MPFVTPRLQRPCILRPCILALAKVVQAPRLLRTTRQRLRLIDVAPPRRDRARARGRSCPTARQEQRDGRTKKQQRATSMVVNTATAAGFATTTAAAAAWTRLQGRWLGFTDRHGRSGRRAPSRRRRRRQRQRRRRLLIEERHRAQRRVHAAALQPFGSRCCLRDGVPRAGRQADVQQRHLLLDQAMQESPVGFQPRQGRVAPALRLNGGLLRPIGSEAGRVAGQQCGHVPGHNPRSAREGHQLGARSDGRPAAGRRPPRGAVAGGGGCGGSRSLRRGAAALNHAPENEEEWQPQP